MVGFMSLSHIGFSTLEDTIAVMCVLAPEFYIFCEVGVCFVLIFWWVFVSNCVNKKNTF